jgi:hypothetical protein
MDDVITWLRTEHEQTVNAARAETGLLPYAGGPAGRNMSLIWALNDFRPDDGGPPLMARYAQRPRLSSHAREIARSLADARLAVYLVSGRVHGTWLELDPLAGGPPVRIAGGIVGTRGSKPLKELDRDRDDIHLIAVEDLDTI